MSINRYLAIAVFSVACSAHASIIQHIGNYAGWDSVQWQAIGGLDDADNGLVNEQLDFVGNSMDRAAFWSIDDSYVYFRMRLDIGAVSAASFHDAHFVLIDAIGYGADDGRPDFGFAWDSKSNDPTRHGLEMSVLDTLGSTWATTRMDDLDGNAANKLVNDINGGGRTTDGYIQSTDGVMTADFGTTTFLDYAVSLSYLSNYVPTLVQNNQWRIQFGSIANATDHNPINADLAGNTSPSDVISLNGWSQPVAIPEPAVIGFVCLFGGGLLVVKRLFRA